MSGYFEGRFEWDEFKNCDKECTGFFLGCMPCFCCYTSATLLSILCWLRKESRPCRHPGIRIGLSMIEWIFLIIWALVFPDRFKFLFSFQYGLSVFILGVICYLIHSQYLYFFPDFSLPHRTSIRSMYGYAFNGELEEIQRLKVPNKFQSANAEWDDDNPENSKLPAGIKRNSIFGHAFYGDLDACKKNQRSQSHVMATPHKKYSKKMRYMTPIMLAISNKQDHVVNWVDNEDTTLIHGKFL